MMLSVHSAKENIQRSLLEKNKGLSTPTNNSSNVISHLESTSKFHQGNSAIRSQKRRVKPIVIAHIF